MYHGIPNLDHLVRLTVPMEKGDTIFFHPLLLHGSGPNLTKVNINFIIKVVLVNGNFLGLPQSYILPLR